MTFTAARVRWLGLLAISFGGACAQAQVCGMRALDLREPAYVGDQPFTLATALSRDGSIVVGVGFLPGGAAAWNAEGHMRGLPQLADFPYGICELVSEHGTVMFGHASNNAFTESHAFRFDASTNTMEDLGILQGCTTAVVHAISADGSVAVGEMFGAQVGPRAFRWSVGDGLQDLGNLGGSLAVPTGVSADGNVVVGYADLGQSNAIVPFRWAVGEGIRPIGDLCDLAGDVCVSRDGSSAVYTNGIVIRLWTMGRNGDPDTTLDLAQLGWVGPDFAGRTYAISGDGTTVVGRTRDGTWLRAFRWTVGGGVEYLGSADIRLAWATDVSDDGSVVAGNLFDTQGLTRPFRWTSDGGMQVHEELDASTLDVMVVGLSGDGSVIAGNTTSSAVSGRAFRWSLSACHCPADLNGDGDVSEDLVPFLVAFESGDRVADLDNDGDPAASMPDGAVTIDDLIYFLARFENGC